PWSPLELRRRRCYHPATAADGSRSQSRGHCHLRRAAACRWPLPKPPPAEIGFCSGDHHKTQELPIPPYTSWSADIAQPSIRAARQTPDSHPEAAKSFVPSTRRRSTAPARVPLRRRQERYATARPAHSPENLCLPL